MPLFDWRRVRQTTHSSITTDRHYAPWLSELLEKKCTADQSTGNWSITTFFYKDDGIEKKPLIKSGSRDYVHKMAS